MMERGGSFEPVPDVIIREASALSAEVFLFGRFRIVFDAN
jgi:hypothetical protein